MGSTAVAPQDTGNPFDVPLNSEVQESQQRAQTKQATAPDSANPFDEPLASEKAEADHAAATEASNEKNATVVVPDAGHIPGIMSFGNKVTPKQAAGGVAAGAAVGAAPFLSEAAAPVLRHIATEYGQPAIAAIKSAAESHPLVAKLITHALETAAGMKMADYMGAFSKWSGK